MVVVLVTFFPVTVALLDGLAGTSRDATLLLQTMGASRRQVLLKLRLPGALPSLFTGLRIAVTYAVIGAIFGEQVGAVNGLGIWIILSKNLFRTDLVFGAILVTASLTLASVAAGRPGRATDDPVVPRVPPTNATLTRGGRPDGQSRLKWSGPW